MKTSNGKLSFGVYADSENIKGEKIIETIGLRDVLSFEKKTGLTVNSVMWYPTWNHPNKGSNFPISACQTVKKHGAVPHLVWELCLPGANPCRESIPLEKIVSGDYDSYIASWALDATDFQDKLFIRFMHEFNGTWYGWSGIKNKRNTELFIEAWQHVVDIFRREGAANVSWIWSPNGICGGTPDSNSWNNVLNYWPGDEYVDMIGFDAYNFYPFFEGEQPLRSFDECFAEIYAQCCRIAPKRIKFMIAEMATGEYSAPSHRLPNKAAWIEDAVRALESKNYSRIEWFYWFDVSKELDWRVDSSKSSLEEFKKIRKILR